MHSWPGMIHTQILQSSGVLGLGSHPMTISAASFCEMNDGIGFKIFMVICMAISGLLLYTLGSGAYRGLGLLIETDAEKEQKQIAELEKQERRKQAHEVYMRQPETKVVCTTFTLVRPIFDMSDWPPPWPVSDDGNPLPKGTSMYFAGTDSWIQYRDGKYYLSLAESLDGPFLECIDPVIETMTISEWENWERTNQSL